MSFKVTTSGLDGLLLVTAQQSLVKAMREAALAAIEPQIPKDTGLMKRRLVRSKTERTADGYRVSIGPIGDLPTEHLEGHPIAEFIDYMVRTYGAENVERRKPREPELAWHYLTKKQKAELRRLRLTGYPEMGGPYMAGGQPSPRYYWAVEEGKVPGVSNANANFSDRARQAAQEAIMRVMATWTPTPRAPRKPKP